MAEIHPAISFVIPVFNEEDNLMELVRRIDVTLSQLHDTAEVVFVDDGSTDTSAEMIAVLHAKDPRIHLVQLSRNFGHQIAVTAGLDFSRGDAVIVMDADLQDPPELALEMIERWRDGYDIVYAVRDKRDHESALMSWGRRMFYRLLNRIGDLEIPVDTGDFRLISRRAVNVIKALPEYNRYVRGLCAWVGFRQGEVHYERPARHAGESKYPLLKLVKLGLDGVTGFSRAPLQFVLYLGLSMSTLALLCGIGALVLRLVKPGVIEGWASTVIILTFIGGVQLFALGIIADYIGRIHEEVKMRPIYVVGKVLGIDEKDIPNTRMVYSPEQKEMESTASPDSATKVQG